MYPVLYCTNNIRNKYLLAFSLKKNWEILTYDRTKPKSDERMKHLSAIEGIKVLGIQGVIFSHVLLVHVYSYSDNPHFVEKMYDQFGWQAVLNSPVWLQAFFSMSAFLTTYSVLITVDKSPITLVKCIMSVLNRYIRLTPAAGVALWFTMTWYPLLGSGPLWGWLVVREAEDCSERWWYHLVYAQNHLPTGKFCMGHTWYLAADLQLHAIGLLVLLVVIRWRKAVAPVLTLLLLGSALTAGLVSYFYDITPIITGQAPESLRTWFAGNTTLTMLYLPSWMNLVGYVAGIATAFIYHYTQVEGYKLNQSKSFNLLFHAAITLGSCVVFVGAVFLRDAPPPRWAAGLYAALDRTLVAVFFNVFLLGCFSKCKSGLRSMFEWRGFHFLGRVSYCVFLIHFIVLRLSLGGSTQLVHTSIYSMINLLISVTVLSYLLAIPYCMIVELPVLQLWKAFFEGDRGDRRPQETPVRQPQPAVKPLDLVANIRRRQEV
ncbi:hypothetical protein ABMA28_006570 [Loxostege sticticalis]|uniref:Acyltransferase 3 domain-containing protein n=1 Tax=Loxostege sticticalis TaxID=481309 RepID=A0ABD0SLP0_LOXSC